MATRWKLNLRFTLVLFGVLAILVVGLFASNRFFQPRVNNSLRVRAEELFEQESWRQCAESFRHYLIVSPEDTEARIKFAQAVDRGSVFPADKRQAIRLYFEALADPTVSGRTDLRLRLARLLYEVGRHEDAVSEANMVLEGNPDSAEALAIRALAGFQLAAEGDVTDWSGVAADLERAFAAGPDFTDRVNLAMRLATAYRDDSIAITSAGKPDGEGALLTKADRIAAADRVMDSLVAEHADQPNAYLARYAYRRAHGNSEADADLDRAIDLAEEVPPEEAVDVWIAAGSRRLADTEGTTEQSKTLEEAQAFFEKALAWAPDQYAPYMGLSSTCKARFILDDNPTSLSPAINKIREALETEFQADDVPLNLELVLLHHLHGDSDEANAILAQLDEQIRKGLVMSENRTWIAAWVEANLLRARILLDNGDLAAAIKVLNQVVERQTTTVRANLPETSQVHLLLARYFRELGQPDREAQALEDAIAEGADVPEVHRATARAWMAAGNPELADRHYERSFDGDGFSDTATIDAARWTARQIAALPPGQRDWQPAIEAVDAAGTKTETQVAARILAAEIALVDGRRDDAIAILQAAERSESVTPNELRSLALAWQALDLSRNADRALKAYETKATPVEFALLSAQIQARRDNESGAMATLQDALARLVNAADKDGENELRVALAVLQISQGRLDDARQTLSPTIEAPNVNIAATRLWAAMALSTQSWDDLRQAEELLKSVEGENGVDWKYFRARRLLASAESVSPPDDEVLKEVATLAQQIESVRPRWVPGMELKARVLESQGQLTAAVAAYQRVIEANTRGSSAVANRAVDLLMSASAAATDSSQVARIVSQSVPLSLTAIGREIAAGNTSSAIEIGEEATRRSPNDPRLQLWYAFALQQDQQFDGAEAAFRRSIELAPGNPTAWYGLLGLFSVSDQNGKVPSLVRSFSKTSPVPEPQRSIFILRAADVLGDASAAKRIVDALIEKHPEDVTALKEAGRWYIRQDLAKAEELLRTALDLNIDRETTHMLARVLAASGAAESFHEANRLLTKSGPVDQLVWEDARLYAGLLASRGGDANRKEAITILRNRKETSGSLAPRDQLLLAELLERDGQVRAAGEVLAESVTAPDARSDQLVPYVTYLLRNRESADQDYLARADQTITRIVETEPDGLNAVYLRTRWLDAAGERSKVTPLVSTELRKRLPTLSDSQSKADLLVGFADTMEGIGLTAAAEKLYRQAARLGGNNKTRLILFLCRQKTSQATSEAFAIAYQMISDGQEVDGAVALGQVLLLTSTDTDQRTRAEQLINSTLKRHPDDPNLLLTVGSMLCYRGDFQAAVPVLRRLIAIAPSNYQAKNNLAFALALSNKSDEAGDLVNQAIGFAGPQTGLLDTRAIVLIQQDKPLEAVDDLLEITRREPKEAVYWLHLALAQIRAGDRSAAHDAWLKARAHGIFDEKLTKFDEKAAATLAQAF